LHWFLADMEGTRVIRVQDCSEGGMRMSKATTKPLSISDLERQYERERKAWSEAFSIPAGCGCTPFYADARDESARTRKLYRKLADESPAQARRFKEKHPDWKEVAP
jgi:hypothetical protein